MKEKLSYFITNIWATSYELFMIKQQRSYANSLFVQRESEVLSSELSKKKNK